MHEAVSDGAPDLKQHLEYFRRGADMGSIWFNHGVGKELALVVPPLPVLG